MAWSLWGYQPDATTVLLAAMWPLFLLGSLVLLGRGGSRQTMSLAAAAIALVVLLIVVSAFDRSYFEVRNFLILVPLVLLLIARLITGWIRQPRARLLVAGGVAADAADRPGRSAAQQGQSPAVRLPRRDPGHQGECRARTASSCSSRPTCATCSSTTRRTSAASPSPHRIAAAARGEPRVRPRLVPEQQGVLQCRRTGSSDSSRSSERSCAASRHRKHSSGSSNEQSALGRPPSAGHVGARAEDLERAPAGAHPDPARGALRGVVLRLAAQPGPRRHPRTSTAS